MKYKRTTGLQAASAGALALALAAGLAIPGTARAQESEAETAASPSRGLDEIVVTAQRRAENLQDVPIAIAAVTADALAEAGIDSTAGISQAVPAVQFTRSGPSGMFFVRGVGTTSGAAGEEGANAFYIDNVYLPDLGQTINNFNNVERIEVLKGPQGTLFGRNAFGGLVHIITKEPGDVFEMRGEVSYANYDTLAGKVYVAGPLSENLSLDLALTAQDQGDGWGRNVTTGKDVHRQDYWGARSKLVFRAGSDAKFILAGDYYKTKDDTGTAWRIDDDSVGTGGQPSPGGQNSSANHPQMTELENYGVSFTGEVGLGFAALTSITSYRKSNNVSALDVDSGPLPLIAIDYTSGSRAYQQELRLASEATTPLSWQIGAFYLNARAANTSLFSGAAFAPSGLTAQLVDAALKTESFAAFGEITYEVTPSTHLTGGLRWTKDTRELSGDITLLPLSGATPTIVPVGGKLDYDEFTWRIALRQEFTPEINAYASINRGFKAGTFSLQSPLNAPVNPQYITAYEIGLKTELFDRMLRFNVAAYHYDISDYQVRSAALGAGSSLLLNAASVKVDGIDVEFEAAPADGLRIFGGFSILDSRFSSFGGPGAEFQAPFIYPNPAVCDSPPTFDSDPGQTTGPLTGGGTTCFGDATGHTTPLAPDFAASLGMSYTIPVHETGELRFSSLVSYNSGYPFEPDNFLTQKEFVLVNGSIAYWPQEHWGFEIWGRNLTDTKWYPQRAGQPTGNFAVQAPPRQYGITFKTTY